MRTMRPVVARRCPAARTSAATAPVVACWAVPRKSLTWPDARRAFLTAVTIEADPIWLCDGQLNDRACALEQRAGTAPRSTLKPRAKRKTTERRTRPPRFGSLFTSTVKTTCDCLPTTGGFTSAKIAREMSTFDG